jgi:hypothetical protein
MINLSKWLSFLLKPVDKDAGDWRRLVFFFSRKQFRQINFDAYLRHSLFSLSSEEVALHHLVLLQQVVNLLSYLHQYHLGVGTDFLCLLSQLTDLLVKLCLLHLPALVDLCEYLFYLAHELLVCTILRRDNSENTGERKVNLVVRLEEGHHICFPVVIIEGGD